jgi:hypothetical protein
MNYRLTEHVLEVMRERRIAPETVESVLQNPQQVIPASNGRKAYQSRLEMGGSNVYLVRVILDDRIDPAVVVTVYRTTKIGKYWRDRESNL